MLIIALETLFIQVRNDSAIRGFRVRSVETKLSAYADDTTFLVKVSHSLNRILKLTGKFQEFSSLKFSIDKPVGSEELKLLNLSQSNASGAHLLKNV